MIEHSPGMVIVRPSDGRKFKVFGDTVVVKLPGTTFNAPWSIVERVSPVGSGSAPIVSNRYDLSFYILLGELEWWLPQGTIRTRSGSLVHIPKDTPFSYTSVGKIAAKFLSIGSPADYHRMEEEFSIPSQSPENFAELDIIGAKYGLRLVTGGT